MKRIYQVLPTTLVVVILGVFSPTLFAQNRADDVIGVWQTAGGKSNVEIMQTNGVYSGKFIYLKEPNTPKGTPKVDRNNPDPTRRTDPIIGLSLLKGFRFDGAYEWKGGKIYDPENGKTYSCYMKLADWKTLKIRGYIGISLLGRTEAWTRVK